MSATDHILNDEALSPTEKLDRLQDMVEALTEAMHRLTTFRKKTMAVQESTSIEDALDQMELLIDDVLEFTYLQFYRVSGHDEPELVRAMCPESLQADSAMMTWAIEKQEIAIVPLEDPIPDEDLESIVLMPLAGNAGTAGLAVLWLESDAAQITQEDRTLLELLARETATVIEAHRFRQRLEEARSTISDVLESVPHGLMATDPKQNISMLNSTMEIMLNIRRDEVMGKPVGEALPKQIATTLNSMFTSGEMDEKEITVDLRGMEETLGISLNALQAEGEDNTAFGYVIVCRDLKLSHEVAKLRELDSMKNQFLSLVSHELRTPLTSIMAYSETLLMEGMIDTEEERKEYLQIIYDEGARLSRLINDVLDLTKMEAGKMDFHFEEQPIADVVSQALGSSNSLASQKGVNLVTELDDDLPDVRYDSDRIMQVMMNLISNAIKFTDEGGSITINAIQTEPFEHQAVPTVTVSVRDTGCGIAPENLDRVFSKFEQIENIDHHSVGTGLGMPICKQIVEEGHGGQIWIESEVGVGTTVLFRIPAC